MPEGDTIHRVARRMSVAIAGKQLERVATDNPRSPIHGRAAELEGATIELAEAKGKHLLVHFDNDLVVHSHLGMSGRWFIRADGRLPWGDPWLLMATGPGIASVTGGKILRLVSATRARNDPMLMQLGPDPLHRDFDDEAAARRLLGWDPAEPVGAALLDQSLIAGIGNVIRIEALFIAKVDPWRKVGELTDEEALELVRASRWIMETAIRRGSRPKQIYGRARMPCPRCGGQVQQRGQGDDNRTTFWCRDCQL